MTMLTKWHNVSSEKTIYNRKQTKSLFAQTQSKLQCI